MHILAIWLIAMPGTLRSGETPVVFARSGQRFSLPASIGYKSHQGPLAFWAFGKPWGEPMVMEDDKVEFVAPSVRVPIVFQLKSNRDTHCELVVYPDQPFSWDQDVEFAAVMASDWFTTWAKATDMPVEFLEIRDLHAPAAWRSRKSRGLLILENSVYRESADVAWHLAKKHETNVLWLGADWFAANMGMQPAMVLLPAQMVGPLADLQPQDWPLPPAFDQKRPWILNRQTWIVGPVHPLVEETRIPEKGKEHLRVVWSYLPWARQLGRNEAAEA